MAKYTLEFKREAVDLYESSGSGIKRTADGLGIAPETLRHWVKQSHDAGQLDTAEHERMRQMEKEHGNHSVSLLCKGMKVIRASYYARIKRDLSEQEIRDAGPAVLSVKIKFSWWTYPAWWPRQAALVHRVHVRRTIRQYAAWECYLDIEPDVNKCEVTSSLGLFSGNIDMLC